MDFPAKRLREAFEAAGYTVDGVLRRIGEAGQAGLGRNQTMPARRALGEAGDPLATLIRLFLLQQPAPAEHVDRALPGLTDTLLALDIVRCAPDGLRAAIDLRPYATDDEQPRWIVSDLTPGLDGPAGPMRPDYVLGVSSASTTLAQLTIRRPIGRALDLGTGCGVQSLHLAAHADEIIATDLNPRAIRLAAWTAALNQVAVDLREGDLYEPVAGETFDLIITNPPYVIAPPADDDRRLTYREATRTGDELVREVITAGLEHLAPGGTLQILGNWAHQRDGDWAGRLRDWLPATGVRALIIERELLDPFEYVELWLTDAGLFGTPGYADAYARWLDYFAELGITAVGMGWITIRRIDDATPSDIAIESWPHAVQQPVGGALAEWLDAAPVAQLGEAELFGRTFTIAPDVDAETIGRPGAADPEHLLLRRRAGLRRAVRTDTALAAVAGACDGDLPLGVIVDAVAGLLDADAGDLRTDLTPRLRGLIADGFLRG